MTTPQHADLAIIGAGSGNGVPGEEPEGRTVLFEEGLFGGTCLNAGCIPSKMLVKAAESAKAPRRGAVLGIDASLDTVRWDDIRARVFGRLDAIEASGREYRESQSPVLEAVTEHVEFTGPGRLRTASGAEWTADRIVIAAGARPRIPVIDGLDPAVVDLPGSRIVTSESVMRLEELPRHITILGGGYIAMEMAHIFSGLGSEVTVIVRSDVLLRAHDEAIRRSFADAAAEAWDVRFETGVVRLSDGERLHLTLDSPRGAQRLDTDALLIAAGRVSNADRLGAEHAGIDVHEDGRIAVDEYLRVHVGGEPRPGLYALGDVSSPYQLKHVANHEARVVAANLRAERLGERLQRVNHAAVPSAVFSDPQIAAAGLTEEQARREHGEEVRVVVHDYADVAYGWALEERRGFVKLVAEPSGGRLLGAHILGPEASAILQPLIGVLAFDLDPRRFAREQYWIHPALPEVVENALLKLGD